MKKFICSKTISIYILILISISILSSFSVSHAYGQMPNKSTELIKVSPVILYLNLTPSTINSYPLIIENLTDKAFPTTLTFETFNTSDEEGGYIFDESTTLFSQWLTIPTKDFILAPHEKRTVNISLNIPNQVPIGGYYGMIFINPVLSPSTTNITLAPKIGVLLLANIGVDENQDEKILIEEFNMPFISENGTSNYILRIKNNSLFHFSAKPKVTYTPLFGNKKTSNPEEKYIFPGKIRKWENTTDLPQFPNIYKARLSLSVGEGKQIHREKILVVFPVYKTTTAIVIVLATIFVISKKKRLKKAARILITNKD